MRILGGCKLVHPLILFYRWEGVTDQAEDVGDFTNENFGGLQACASFDPVLQVGRCNRSGRKM